MVAPDGKPLFPYVKVAGYESEQPMCAGTVPGCAHRSLPTYLHELKAVSRTFFTLSRQSHSNRTCKQHRESHSLAELAAPGYRSPASPAQIYPHAKADGLAEESLSLPFPELKFRAFALSGSE